MLTGDRPFSTEGIGSSGSRVRLNMNEGDGDLSVPKLNGFNTVVPCPPVILGEGDGVARQVAQKSNEGVEEDGVIARELEIEVSDALWIGLDVAVPAEGERPRAGSI